MTIGPYRAVIVRDEDGYWFIDFPEVPGCHTQGRTLRAARTRMHDALSLFVEEADTAPIVEDLRLPDDAIAAVRRPPNCGSRTPRRSRNRRRQPERQYEACWTLG